jgi:hypothetical protein
MKQLMWFFGRKNFIRQAFETFIRYNEGQKLRRKWQSDFHKLEKQKPVYASNYMHVIMYRKCNACDYTGADFSFILRQEIAAHTETSVSYTQHTHCPKCGSENLGSLHWDKELNLEYQPPKISLTVIYNIK